MDFLNVIVDSGNNLRESDRENIFDNEEVLGIKLGELDMFDLLVKLGAFSSKSQARKNWKQTGKDIPIGFSEFVVGKLKRSLTIWNPIEWEDIPFAAVKLEVNGNKVKIFRGDFFPGEKAKNFVLVGEVVNSHDLFETICHNFRHEDGVWIQPSDWLKYL